MWVKSLQLQNVKGFVDSGKIEFSNGINVLAGANNSGKSTILRSIQALQPTSQAGNFLNSCMRHGATDRAIILEVGEPHSTCFNVPPSWFSTRNWSPKITFRAGGNNQIMVTDATGINQAFGGGSFCNPQEPRNFIYPYFSARKNIGFDLTVNQNNTLIVDEHSGPDTRYFAIG